MPAISIIVPIYKVEPYLRKCVDSILAQTFTDFELILIDDGSPDNCGKICDEYKEKDERVIVIHQKNAGVSAARNAGLEIAKGDYISFIDSDDWVEPDMYEVLYYAVKDSGADMGACYDCIGDYKPAKVNKNEYVIFSPKEAVKNLLDDKYDLTAIMGKLIARNIIDNMRFSTDISMAEDALFITEAIINCKKFAYIGYQCYHYVIREDSATHDLKDNFWTICVSMDKMVNIITNFDNELGEYAAGNVIKMDIYVSKVSETNGKLSKNAYRKIISGIRKYKNKDSVKALSRSQKCWFYLLILGRIPFIAGRKFFRLALKMFMSK